MPLPSSTNMPIGGVRVVLQGGKGTRNTLTKAWARPTRLWVPAGGGRGRAAARPLY